MRKYGTELLETNYSISFQFMRKICDMRTLLKYAKNAAICEICGNRNRIKLTCLINFKTITRHHFHTLHSSQTFSVTREHGYPNQTLTPSSCFSYLVPVDCCVQSAFVNRSLIYINISSPERNAAEGELMFCLCLFLTILSDQLPQHLPGRSSQDLQVGRSISVDE